MLNISNNSVRDRIDSKQFQSFKMTEKKNTGRVLIKMLWTMSVIILAILFLPWTQNVRSKGNVTALRPDQRPQTVHSVIGGRIEKWYVQEGDAVNKGDTILYISEIKDEYFDPKLIDRTSEQLSSKKQSAVSYKDKAGSLEEQITALKETRDLKVQQNNNKLKQADFKVQSDSAKYAAEMINYEVASKQFTRLENLYKDGLKSLTDLEKRKLTLQKTESDVVSAKNQLLASQNELLNIKMELLSIEAQYRDDIAKAQSEKFSALSSMFDTEATVSKLENQLSSYSIRNALYFITAPLDGYITKAIQSGIGETIKAGSQIISIMPRDYDLAVEMYIKPIDLPLLEKGQNVRVQFDGWPAIVFSGWPNTSYGTYGGEIFAIDNFISSNGMFRVLVIPDPDDYPWPDALRPGGGTSSMILLKDVAVWYEMWRQINGFPPDYYKLNESVPK